MTKKLTFTNAQRKPAKKPGEKNFHAAEAGTIGNIPRREDLGNHASNKEISKRVEAARGKYKFKAVDMGNGYVQIISYKAVQEKQKQGPFYNLKCVNGETLTVVSSDSDASVLVCIKSTPLPPALRQLVAAEDKLNLEYYQRTVATAKAGKERVESAINDAINARVKMTPEIARDMVKDFGYRYKASNKLTKAQKKPPK